jgi:hypothetical protein
MSIPSFTPSLAKIRKEVIKGRTMRIVETFTKQHPEATLGAVLRTMHGVATYKTTISGKEQIRVGTSQSG